MAKRTPRAVRPVRNLAEANRALAEIASLRRSLRREEDALNQELERLRARAEAAAAPLRARLQGAEAGLQAFAELHKDALFQTRRSCELECGSLGFRRSSALRTARGVTWAEVLRRLEDRGRLDGVRRSRSVNREVLRTWPDTDLSGLGVHREERDSFWYETNEARLDAEGAGRCPDQGGLAA
jgi:phage host-nuclease inhibitor protein Gam